MNLFKKTTAAVALVTLVSGIFSTGVSAYSNAEVEAANYLAGEGVINTKATAAEYNLDQNVLRQEIAKVAVNMAADVEMKDSCDGSFTDVTATTPNTWACGYVEALLDAGLVSANATFRPEDNISKSEAVKMVLEAAGYTDIYTNVSNWQEEVVSFAVDAGVVSSFTNYNTMATRGFVFEAAHNAMVTMEDDSTDDLLSDLLNGLDDEETTEEMTEEDDSTEVVVSGDNVLVVELSPETPNEAFVPYNRARTELLAFDVTAGSEDVTLKTATLEYVGLSDSSEVKDLTIYMSNNEISRTSRDFNSDKEAELTFEKETVIKAGETKTLFVTATVTSTTNVAHRIALTDIEATSTVEMSTLYSERFNVVDSSNTSTVEYRVKSVSSGELTVGEVETLADFSLETSKEEDVTLGSLTFEVSGQLDAEDDLSDVVLYADGEEIASDLMVNSDDEIIVQLDYVIPADEKVDFKLEGVVTGSIGTSSTTVELTDIYVVGNESVMVSNVVNTSNVAFTTVTVKTFTAIVGSEINISFDKSDIDEAKPNADAVLVGTVKLSAMSDYTIDRLVVKTDSLNGSGVLQIIDDMELDGVAYDEVSTSETTNVAATNSSTGVYFVFNDISLNAGEEVELDLIFDVVDEVSLNGQSLDFKVKVVEVTDEENDESYDSSNVAGILSTNVFDTKNIDVESASLTLNSTSVNKRTLVLGDNIDVVWYKAKLSTGDSDDVVLNNVNFVVNTNDSGEDLDDLIANAELNIGGQTFDADIDADSVDFDLNAVVAAGTDNLEVVLTLTLKDNDNVSNNDELILEVEDFDSSVAGVQLDAEDYSEGEYVLNQTTTNVNTKLASVELLDRGTFAFELKNDADNDDKLENTVLAGSNGVVLAELEFNAEYEDAEVENLVFTLSGVDATSTIENARLISEDNEVIATAQTITLSGSDTLINFTDLFNVEEALGTFDVELVVDVNSITGVGGETSATAQVLVVDSNVSLDVAWASSNDDYTVGVELTKTTVDSEQVSIVPTMLAVSVDTSLDQSATPKIDIYSDSGNNTDSNEESIDSIVTSLSFSTLGTTDADDSLVYQLVNDKDSSDIITGSLTGSTLTFDLTNLSNVDNRTIEDGKTATFKIVITGATTDADTAQLTLLRNGVVYNADATTGINVNLEDELDFGTRSY